MKKFLFLLILILIIFTGVKTEQTQAKTPCKEVCLTTCDNKKIAINHYKSSHNTVLIIAPGWFMGKDSKPFKSMAEDFSTYYDVISLDFRGHCHSSGTFTFTCKEPEDLRQVINYAKGQYSKIYLIGFSLGGATATIHTEKEKNIDKLILVSTPVSFDKIENEMWKKEAFIPTIEKFELKTWCKIRPGKFWLKKTNPIDIIQNISPTPILILAGENDPTVHSWHAKALYEKAKEPKKIIIFKQANHAEDLYIKDPQKFVNTCVNWLNN